MKKKGILFIPLFLVALGGIAYAGLSDGYHTPTQEKVSQNRTTTGGGSRSPVICLQQDKNITLLVPPEEQVYYTKKGKPSFYLKVSSDNKNKNWQPIKVKFNLVSEQNYRDNPIIQQELNLNKTGIYQIKLPNSIALNLDELYFWQIGIICTDNNKVINTLRAGVKRIKVSPQSSDRHFWYDLLDSAYLQRKKSKDFEQLLKSIKVE